MHAPSPPSLPQPVSPFHGTNTRPSQPTSAQIAALAAKEAFQKAQHGQRSDDAELARLKEQLARATLLLEQERTQSSAKDAALRSQFGETQAQIQTLMQTNEELARKLEQSTIISPGRPVPPTNMLPPNSPKAGVAPQEMQVQLYQPPEIGWAPNDIMCSPIHRQQRVPLQHLPQGYGPRGLPPGPLGPYGGPMPPPPMHPAEYGPRRFDGPPPARGFPPPGFRGPPPPRRMPPPPRGMPYPRNGGGPPPSRDFGGYAGSPRYAGPYP
eukprot:NODE_2872_length_1099_cov_29.461905_g2634_i0.p1 GENE.NODE_2872_length_1099_cov_29.461905_g2634_i0~~NODE_2872_length_1099_cov_29.461905_g2634_i0.p1  ORF type:complete len:312 (-),score=22.21 NODE_2872_length_1099_cov_29.461905_g2634_i0:163-966(-)